MSESLSVIVPVHNAQNDLAGQVADLLEVLPELTCDFEVLIVDDHSTDSTEEVLIPAVESVVKEIDLENRLMRVDMPEGL